jgi:hypothetical protein
MPVTGSRNRRAPYWITGNLAIGPCRGAGGPTVDSLVEMGFKHDIDLNADNSERSLARRAGIVYHPVKIIDEDGLQTWLENLHGVVDIIEEATRKKEKVYLHCTYGKGRSATASMAYLVSEGWTVRDAIEFVKEKGELVWEKGNPVAKYSTILRAYSKVGKKNDSEER